MIDSQLFLSTKLWFIWNTPTQQPFLSTDSNVTWRRPLLQRHQVHQVPVTAELPRLLRVFWHRPPGRRNRWTLLPWQLGFHFNRFKTSMFEIFHGWEMVLETDVFCGCPQKRMCLKLCDLCWNICWKSAVNYSHSWTYAALARWVHF